MALLALAATWAKTASRELLVLTVDHGLRAEGAEEAVFVAREAQALGLAHRTLEWHAPAAAQAKARRARHALLADAARSAGARLILTGHTLDDDLETFLMRARRGSGWRGLAGMGRGSASPVWPAGRTLMIARPLLGLSRLQLRDALKDFGASWVEDPTNENTAYERVRWRRHLTDKPSLRGRVQGLQEDLKMLRRLESRALARWLTQEVSAEPDGSLMASLAGLSAPATEPALDLLIQIAAGRDRRPDAQRLRRLAEDVERGGSDTACTLGGAWIERTGNQLLIARDPGLVEPGDGDVWDGRFVREAGAPQITPTARMTRGTLPPDEDGWRCLAPERLTLTACALLAY